MLKDNPRWFYGVLFSLCYLLFEIEYCAERIYTDLRGGSSQPGLGLDAGSVAVTSGRQPWLLITPDTDWTCISCSSPFFLLQAYTARCSSHREPNSHTDTFQTQLQTHRGGAGVRVSYSGIQQTLVCQRCGGRSSAGQLNAWGGGVSVNATVRLKLCEPGLNDRHRGCQFEFWSELQRRTKITPLVSFSFFFLLFLLPF